MLPYIEYVFDGKYIKLPDIRQKTCVHAYTVLTAILPDIPGLIGCDSSATTGKGENLIAQGKVWGQKFAKKSWANVVEYDNTRQDDRTETEIYFMLLLI